MSETKNFEDLDRLWRQAKDGDDDSLLEFIARFDPLIRKESRIRGVVNEDLVDDVKANLVVKLKRYIQAWN